MPKILINRNETTGVETWYETEDDQQRATTEQDVSDILDYAHDMRSATQGEKYGDMRKVAVMPMAVVGQAIREGWFFDQERIRRWVKENPAFKTFDKGF